MYVALSDQSSECACRTGEDLYDLVCAAAVQGGNFTSTSVLLTEAGEDFMRVASSKGHNADWVRSARYAALLGVQRAWLIGIALRTGKPASPDAGVA